MLCVLMGAELYIIFKASRIVATSSNVPADRTSNKQTTEATIEGGNVLGSGRSSFKRRLRKHCQQRSTWAMGVVAACLGALVNGPPTVNLAEVPLPPPVTTCCHHRT